MPGGYCALQPCFVDENGRLVFVMISQLSGQAVREGLQPCVDEVFLPRKIHFVAAIPRNETGKLAKIELEKHLASLV